MSINNLPIKEFRLNLSDLTFTGHDLVRPESILAQPDGTLWASDGRGGVTSIAPNGEQRFIASPGGEPNGLAMTDDGAILIANIATGALQKLSPATSQVEELLTEVDGVKTTATNFVFIDSKQRLWIAFSTREQQWWSACAHPRPDGYIVLLDEKGPRIVADGIYFTNEIRLDAREEYLYVAETMKNRMLRFRVHPDGSQGEKEVVGPDNLGTGAVIDGFTFDAEENIWVTLPLRNAIGIITPDGEYHAVIEEANEPLLQVFEERAAAGLLEPEDLIKCGGKTLQLLTSVTFGGPDLRTVYAGSLVMSHLTTFRSPVSGLPMRHWR